MYQTIYHRPKSLAEAAQLFNDDARFLSGGMTLLPTMKQRLAAPSDLIDLTHIAELKGIEATGDTLTIGGASTHFEVASSPEAQRAIPMLAHLAGTIGDPAVRHRGTIGGSIANNDPSADYPAALLALGATVHTDQRQMPADEFFTGMFSTALEEGEIVTKVVFPIPQAAAYEKFRNPASRYPMAGVFVAKLKDGSVRVGVTGAGNDGVYRAADMEAALSANLSPDAIKDIEVDPSSMLSDLHGSAEYRANLVKVMAKRAVAGLG